MPTYTVKPGDSPAKIAQMFYGDQRYMQLISQANGGAIMLRPGDKLSIPSKPTKAKSPVVTNEYVAMANTAQAGLNAVTGQNRPLMATTGQLAQGVKSVDPTQAAYWDFSTNSFIGGMGQPFGEAPKQSPTTTIFGNVAGNPQQMAQAQFAQNALAQPAAGATTGRRTQPGLPQPTGQMAPTSFAEANKSTQAAGQLGGGYGAYTAPADRVAKENAGVTVKAPTNVSTAPQDRIQAAIQTGKAGGGAQKASRQSSVLGAGAGAGGQIVQKPEGQFILPPGMTMADYTRKVQVREEQNNIVKAMVQADEGIVTPKFPNQVSFSAAKAEFGSMTDADVVMAQYGYVPDKINNRYVFAGTTGMGNANSPFSPNWYRAVLSQVPTVPQSGGRYGTSGGGYGSASGTGYGTGADRFSVSQSVMGWRAATG